MVPSQEEKWQKVHKGVLESIDQKSGYLVLTYPSDYELETAYKTRIRFNKETRTYRSSGSLSEPDGIFTFEEHPFEEITNFKEGDQVFVQFEESFDKNFKALLLLLIPLEGAGSFVDIQ